MTPEMLLSLEPGGPIFTADGGDESLSVSTEQTGRDGSGRSTPMARQHSASASPAPSLGGVRDMEASRTVNVRYLDSKRLQLLQQAARRQRAVLQRLYDARERTILLARNLEKVSKQVENL